ncbi:DUF354 domain-containing protein [Candidatus Woesearchaeota archaeon]|nr:DUF354 domain-containing protein [Candidatus Woesearchaeota archaeon]
MKIMIDILHPAHVHFFKNFINEMEKEGHEILVTTRKKDVTLELLNLYNIKYISLSKHGKYFLSLPIEWIKRNIKFYFIAKRFKPDVITGIMGATIAPMGNLLGIPSVVFWDTEHTKKLNFMIFKLATLVCVPTCFRGKINKNCIKYSGYHELAYLHPKRFKPDAKILKTLGVKKDEKFTLIRFISWGAIHDLGEKGIKNKEKFVETIKKHSKVFISYEGEMPEELKKYKIKLPVTEIHNILYYAGLYIGEGGTMASEAAVLGTPAICTNPQFCGYIDEQEKKYKLTYILTDEKIALNKAVEILKSKNIKEKYGLRKKKMLEEKIDVTSFIIKTIKKFGN